MKPILSVFALCVLAACSQQQSTPATASSAIAPIVATEPKPSDIYEQLGWLYRQTQAKLANTTPEQADKIYLDYREESKKIIQQINEKELIPLIILFSEEKATPDIKNKVQDLAKWQLEITDVNMDITIRVIPAYEVALFANKVSPATQQFIEIQAEHDKKMVFGDAVILVSWQELGKRVADWEQFVQNNPQHPLAADANKQFEMYANAYLFGSDNTPVVNVGKDDPQLSDIYEEYKKIDQEWQHFAQQYPNSKLTPLFDQVRELVKKNNEEGFELMEQFKQKHFPSLDSKHMNVEEIK